MKTEWEERTLPGIEKPFDSRYTLATTSFSNHYSHEKTFCMESDVDVCNDETPENYEKITKSENENAESITETLRTICKALEKYGYAIIEDEDKRNARFHIVDTFLRRSDIHGFDPSGSEEKESGVYIGTVQGYNIEAFIDDIELEEKTRKIIENGKTVRTEKYYTLPA